MRNGNYYRFFLYFHYIFSSYRTYEEWKPLFIIQLTTKAVQSSYRTYEEWKLDTLSTGLESTLTFLPYLWGMETSVQKYSIHNRSCSYRTYEEWKRSKKMRGNIAMSKSSYRTYEEWKPCQEIMSFVVRRRFLPYLWGMETG